MLDVLVIGAGPYGLAAAKAARDKGLETRVLGRHMSFWREHMPADMFLRSGPDWHLDPAYELTLERFLDATATRRTRCRSALFLAYTDWFTAQARITVEDEHVVALRPGFEAELASGETIRARQVIAAPGIAHFTHTPEWAERRCEPHVRPGRLRRASGRERR